MTRRMLLIAISALLFVFCNPPRAWASDVPPTLAPLPIIDNELVLGGGVGVILLTQHDSEAPERLSRRVGGRMELLSVGLFNRVSNWLDAEFALGAELLWLAEEGFTQETTTLTRSTFYLPGVSLRFSSYLHPSWMGPLILGVGTRATLFRTPAKATLIQWDGEFSLGADLWRTREEHFSLHLVYGLPLDDGLVREEGMPFTRQTQRLGLRVGYGF